MSPYVGQQAPSAECCKNTRHKGEYGRGGSGGYASFFSFRNEITASQEDAEKQLPFGLSAVVSTYTGKISLKLKVYDLGLLARAAPPAAAAAAAAAAASILNLLIANRLTTNDD